MQGKSEHSIVKQKNAKGFLVGRSRALNLITFDRVKEKIQGMKSSF